MTESDVIVVGAGIIGAAYAWQLTARGQRVTLIDDGNADTTAAGMDHLVCMDNDPAELTLPTWSLEGWHKLTPRMSESCAQRRCGTLWLVKMRQELVLAEEKQ